ncbi:uncharacterized protein METZ01_LOCUS294442, partial [marine metagenome]
MNIGRFKWVRVGRFFNLCIPSLLICRISSIQTAGPFASQAATPVLIRCRVSLVEYFLGVIFKDDFLVKVAQRP